MPFLERELIDTLPYVVASTLINFPTSLVEEVVDVLCWNLLPFAITNVNHPSDNCVLPDAETVDFKRGKSIFLGQSGTAVNKTRPSRLSE